MKKLIQVLIVSGLFVFMGGTASGEVDPSNYLLCSGKNIKIGDDTIDIFNWYSKSLQKKYKDVQPRLVDALRSLKKWDETPIKKLIKEGNSDASFIFGIYSIAALNNFSGAVEHFKLAQTSKQINRWETAKECIVFWRDSVAADKKKHGAESSNNCLAPDEETILDCEVEAKIALKEIDKIVSQRKLAEEKKEAEKKAKFNKIMKEAEKYREVISKSKDCKKAEDISKCISVNSCIAASIIEEYKHDDRGKKFKKTMKGGFFSKGSYEKAFEELKKSADKDKSFKDGIAGIAMGCVFAQMK
jgi:hypothetical protein